MNVKALRELEFDQVLKILKKYAFSETGAAAVDSLPFFTDRDLLKKEIDLCNEMIFLFQGGYIPPFSYYGNIKEHILKCEKPGSYIKESDLSEIYSFLVMTTDLIKFIHTHKDNCPELYENIKRIDSENVKIIYQKIGKCIDDNGNIKDNASAQLQLCRSRISSLKKEINSRLNAILTKKTYDKFLQDTFISIKNGRYTIPIKKEMSSKFQGVIQDESQTGHSVFMEPTNVIPINNRIIAETFREEKEIIAILKELADTIRQSSRFILVILDIIRKFELIYIRSKFSIDLNAVFPKISYDAIVKIIDGRHPLIEGNVVPLDLTISMEKPVLVVSGPNAGGKTVALKTTGLFAFMFQHAIPIPAHGNSEFGVFTDILCDIGDHQSIEKNLSTFSSHIVGLKEILDNACGSTLVLIDEIATGTDPTQGEALAISIFEHFHRNRIPSIITTHYSGLKYASIACEHSENASVGFDIEKMRPTYKFYMGIPGSSNAFAVASNYELSEHIIARAKELEKEENKKINEIIEELKNRCCELEYKNDRLNCLRTDLETREQKIQQLEKQLDEKQRDIKKNKIQGLEQYIVEKKKYIEEIIRSLSAKNQYRSIYKVNQLNEEISTKVKETIISEFKIIHKSKVIAGKKVYLPLLSCTGEICEIINSEKIKIDCSGKIVTVDVKTIAEIPEKIKHEKKPIIYNKNIDVSPSDVKIECNIIGKQCDEAIDIISKYLDDVFLSSLNKIRIIHGKGTGRLRNAVHEYLNTNPFVASYRVGDAYEGGIGATVVEIKR